MAPCTICTLEHPPKTDHVGEPDAIACAKAMAEKLQPVFRALEQHDAEQAAPSASEPEVAPAVTPPAEIPPATPGEPLPAPSEG